MSGSTPPSGAGRRRRRDGLRKSEDRKRADQRDDDRKQKERTKKKAAFLNEARRRAVALFKTRSLSLLQRIQVMEEILIPLDAALTGAESLSEAYASIDAVLQARVADIGGVVLSCVGLGFGGGVVEFCLGRGGGFLGGEGEGEGGVWGVSKTPPGRAPQKKGRAGGGGGSFHHVVGVQRWMEGSPYSVAVDTWSSQRRRRQHGLLLEATPIEEDRMLRGNNFTDYSVMSR